MSKTLTHYGFAYISPGVWRNHEKGLCVALGAGGAADTFRAYSSAYPSDEFVLRDARGAERRFRIAVRAALAALGKITA